MTYSNYLLATETTADGTLTTIGYDYLNEPTSVNVSDTVTGTDGGSTSYTAYNADQQVAGTIDPDGNLTTYGYQLDVGDTPGTTVTISQGPSAAVADDSAAFYDLGQNPGSSRVYTVYVQTSAGISSGDVSISGSDGYSSPAPSFSSDFADASAVLGQNWYQLGTLTLASGDTKGALTAAVSGTDAGDVTRIALVFRTAVDTYDPYSNLTQEVDALGNTTTFSYNAVNQPEQQTVSGHSLGPTYDSAGYTVGTTNLQTGAVTEYVYNMLGDTAETISPSASTGTTGEGPVTKDYYNADNQLVESVDASGNVTTYGYDALGNQVATSLPDPSTGEAGGPTTTGVFDLDSEKVQSTDPLGYVTTWTMDAFGNQIAESLPDQLTGGAGGPTTSYTFDSSHDVLTQTDPDGNVTSWTYSPQGWANTETITVPGGTATETYTRDADGNVVALLDFDGRYDTYRFNSLGEETQEIWYARLSGGSANDESNEIDYIYDLRGDTLSASETYEGGHGTDSSVAMTYSGPGEVTGESQQLSGFYNVVLSQAWNADGTRASLAVNIGGTLESSGTVSGGTPDLLNTYGYDYLGEMTGIEQTGQIDGNTVANKYAAVGYTDGLMTSVNTYLASSADSGSEVLHEAIAYNGDSQATSLTYTNMAGGEDNGLLAGYHYTYYSDGPVSGLYSYADTADTGSGGASPDDYATWAEAQYTYTADAQVEGNSGGAIMGAAVSYTTWANAPTSDNSLTVDDNGNRTDNGSTVSAGNQVTYDGTYYYTFDAEGNRTAKYINTHDSSLDSYATDITIYTYDNRDRMTGLKHYASYGDDPDLAIVYSYDAFNRLTQENETAGGSLDERYVWDGGNLLEVLDSSNGVTERYLNAAAVDQVLATEMVGGDNPGVNWLLADAQGSVRDVVRATTDDGEVTGEAAVDHVIYDAYGNQPVPQSATDPQEQTRIAFRGMMNDPLAGFDSTAGSGGGGFSGSAIGLYYSAAQGFYDSISETQLTARQAIRAAR